LSQTPSTMTLALIASGRLVLTQALQGQLHQAAATYQQTLGLAATYGMSAMPWIGVAQVGMGEVLREWNDLEGAEDLVRQGIAHCTESGGLAEMALDGSLTLARVVQARGDTDGALAVLQQAEALGRDGHVAQYAERVALARARLWLTATQGDVAAALHWAGAREEVWRADETPGYVDLLERLTLARLHLMQGRRDEAAALLQWLLGRAEAGGLTGCVLEILALQARIFLEQDHVAQAMIALTRALALAEPQGYVRVFVDEGPPMVALLRHAQARGVAPAYVAALLTACGSAPQAPSPAAPALVEPLSARERELLRLLAAGLSTPEIAAQLFITAGTVRNHLKSIYGKLAVHSRLQAVERARTLDLL
jgi:LuxR family transcriptional regulator, maltose regulon positive regulatory protein